MGRLVKVFFLLPNDTSGLSSQFLVVCLFTRFGEDDQRKEHSSGIQVVSKLSEQSLEKKVSGKGLIVNVSSFFLQDYIHNQTLSHQLVKYISWESTIVTA